MSDAQTSPTAPATPASRPTRLRRLSGKAAAAWLIAGLALTAVLILMALRLPTWIEFEIVVAVWWAVWFAVLSTLLYRGLRIADDHALRGPRGWFSSGSVGSQVASEPAGSWWDGFFWGSMASDDDNPIAWLITVFVLGCLLVVVAWLVIELVLPIIAFLLYFMARGMLAGVVNDRHRCTGRPGRALAWGLVWTTAYTAPLAGAVWLVHFVYERSQGR